MWTCTCELTASLRVKWMLGQRYICQHPVWQVSGVIHKPRSVTSDVRAIPVTSLNLGVSRFRMWYKGGCKSHAVLYIKKQFNDRTDPRWIQYYRIHNWIHTKNKKKKLILKGLEQSIRVLWHNMMGGDTVVVGGGSLIVETALLFTMFKKQLFTYNR